MKGVLAMTDRIDILQHIRAVRGSLKPTLRAVADKVLAHPEAVRGMSIKELAAASGVSEASISRFVRGIGLENYREFSMRMAEIGQDRAQEVQAEAKQGIYDNIGRDDTAASILSKVAHRQMDVARAGLTTLDPDQLESAARMIVSAGMVYFIAAGSSVLAAESGVVRFGRIGIPALYHPDRNNQTILAASFPRNAVAIAISDSGRTKQTLDVAEAALIAGMPVIAITSYPDSPLVRSATTAIFTPPAYEPSGQEPLYESMVSKFGQLLAVDVLYSLCAVLDYDRALQKLQRGDSYISTSRVTRRMNE